MKAKTQKRWIKSAIETAQQETPVLPWQRGKRRAAFVIQREAPSLRARSA